MPLSPPPAALTVSELTRQIKGWLEDKFPAVWIAGEISNLRTPGSGHVYFTLKDANAQIASVMFRGVAARATARLKDGLAVLVQGDISVYERQGQYQVIVRQLLPQGVGALQQAFEELKRKLQAEGLFEQARKKPIPALPQRLGLVTSPTGAALRDFLNIIGRRFPNVQIVIYPVRVQGAGAGAEIAAALDHFNQLHLAGAVPLDVLIVTRGGGSLEDLWAFNEEVVARALARATLPTISAVGHEIDFTIADFVADLRAPTPSAAAELVVKAKDELTAALRQYQQRLNKDLRLRLAELRSRHAALATSYVFRQPAELVRQYQQRVDDQRDRLDQATRSLLDDRRGRLALAAGKFKLLSPQARVANWRDRLTAETRRLDQALAQRRREFGRRLEQTRAKLQLLSPQSTLERGYSITLTAAGKLVKKRAQISAGHTVRTRLADGEFESVVR